jgi:acetyl-CoA carboxylase biotin carboxyl carrier protein
VDIRKVKKLIELLEESGIAEIEISEGEESVRISRYPQQGPAGLIASPASVSAMVPGASVPMASPPADSAPVTPPQELGAQRHEITAPMVGTFYASPTPGAKPFVEIGSEVKPGDTVCIIEAMKMMNQIEADIAGRVVSILAENASPVEFGQPLFLVEEE